MTIENDLVVAVGSYEVNGETKKRWRTIGQLHAAQDGRRYITIDRYDLLALAANMSAGFIETKEGDDRVYVNLFEPKEKKSSGTTRAPAKAQKASFSDDDVPF